MYRKHLIILLFVALLGGCATTDRYALSKDDKGRLVRLDTQTGEVMLIKDGELTPEKAELPPKIKTKPHSKKVLEPMAMSEPAPAKPTVTNNARTYHDHTMTELGNIKITLTTSWYNGKLHFGLEFYPITKRLGLIKKGYYSSSSFSLSLHDKEGEQTASTIIPANRLKQVHSQTRKMEELSAEGAIQMSKQKYDSITEWQLQWNP